MGEKSKEMYPHSVPMSQVKRFLLKTRSCPMSAKYVKMNPKVPKTFTQSTDATLSPSASGSPSTSKFVTCSTTLTGHPTQTNPIINRTEHDMVTNAIATFSTCSGELVHSSGSTVTLPMLHMVENMVTVHTRSLINTNMYKHLQLSTAANTVKKSATGIPKSTLKLNLPLNIKLPANIPPPTKKTILKAPNSIPLKKRVTFENLMATLPSNTTDDTTEKTSQSNQIMNNAVNPNTVQNPWGKVCIHLTQKY